MQKLAQLLRPLVHANHQHPIRQRIQRPSLPNLQTTPMLHQLLDLCLNFLRRDGFGIVEESGFGQERLDHVDDAHRGWARGLFNGDEPGEGEVGEPDGFRHGGLDEECSEEGMSTRNQSTRRHECISMRVVHRA